MLTPREVLDAKARHVPVRDLHSSWSVYACCLGIWRPFVCVDRKAETMLGFEALMWHETLHAVEYHSLLRLTILVGGLVAFSVAVALQLLLVVAVVPVLTVVLWAWSWREQEVRADALAMYGAGLGLLSPEHPWFTNEVQRTRLENQGLAEYRNFLRMHPHPPDVAPKHVKWWEAWKYGRTRTAREARAAARCRRLGWQVPADAGRG